VGTRLKCPFEDSTLDELSDDLSTSVQELQNISNVVDFHDIPPYETHLQKLKNNKASNEPEP